MAAVFDEAFYKEIEDAYVLDAMRQSEAESHPPNGVLAIGALRPLVCGLCLEVIHTGEVYWVDADRPESHAAEDVAHAACWGAELSDATDPYRYFGVRRSDF
jgi:hypothetical protein